MGPPLAGDVWQLHSDRGATAEREGHFSSLRPPCDPVPSHHGRERHVSLSAVARHSLIMGLRVTSPSPLLLVPLAGK